MSDAKWAGRGFNLPGPLTQDKDEPKAMKITDQMYTQIREVTAAGFWAKANFAVIWPIQKMPHMRDWNYTLAMSESEAESYAEDHGDDVVIIPRAEWMNPPTRKTRPGLDLSSNERIAARHYLQLLAEDARVLRNSMDPYALSRIDREAFGRDLDGLQELIDQLRKNPITINRLPGSNE